MRSTFLSLFLLTAANFLAQDALAQTYFYIGSISVDPAEPTTNDVITISLSGDLSSTGASIVSTSYMLVGNTVRITVNAADNGGLTVLVPHTEEVVIDPLPAGSYGILIDGDFVLDSAPEYQHSFNVIGGNDCGTLTLESIQWASFNDTSIVVHVTNNSAGFGYPGFVLLDEDGDTLAVETVTFFAIGSSSWHTLTIHPDADIPTGPFTGELQLWTDFYSELACTWTVEDQLCPEDDCVTIVPYLSNTGGAIALGDFAWTITDANEATAASGTFTLTLELPSVEAEVCLPVGPYAFTVTPLQEPTGGALTMGIHDGSWGMGVQQPLSQVIPTVPLEFDLVPGCFDSPNMVQDELTGAGQLHIRSNDGSVDVRTTTEEPLGTIVLIDAVGRTIFQARTSSSMIQIPMVRSGVYLMSTDVARAKFVISDN